MKPSRSDFHAIRGLRYHVRTWGEAHHPRIFLLHGWMDVSASFQFLVERFSGDWHVVAPDWRGFGLTEWARDGYWFPDYYADLDALLDLYQPGAPVNLVGHSMGGNIAGTYAGLRPEASAAGHARRDGHAAHRHRVGAQTAGAMDGRAARSARSSSLRLVRRSRGAAEAQQSAPSRRSAGAVPRAPLGARKPTAAASPCAATRATRPANPYLYRIEEALAVWRRVTAPALLVNGRDSHIQAWLKDSPGAARGAQSSFPELAGGRARGLRAHDAPRSTARLAAVIECFHGSAGALACNRVSRSLQANACLRLR